MPWAGPGAGLAAPSLGWPLDFGVISAFRPSPGTLTGCGDQRELPVPHCPCECPMDAEFGEHLHLPSLYGSIFLVFSSFLREPSQLSGEIQNQEQGLCSSVSILMPVGCDVLVLAFHLALL